MIKIISREEAKKQGFTSITHVYKGSEIDMLEDAIKTLKNKEYRVVRVKGGLELWRLASEIKEIYKKSVN